MAQKSKIEINLQKLRLRAKELRETTIPEQRRKMDEYELYNGQNAKYCKMRDKLEEYEAELHVFAQTITIIEHHQKHGIPYGDQTNVSITINQVEIVAGSGWEFICGGENGCGESVLTQNREINKIECPKCGKYIWSRSAVKVKVVRNQEE